MKDINKTLVVALALCFVECGVAAQPVTPIFKQDCIGEMKPEEQEKYIASIGGEHSAAGTPKGVGSSPWKHTEHQLGYLPFNTNIDVRPIVSANGVPPNTNLTRIDIRLDRLHVFDYPGDGRHFILFTFTAQNSPTNSGMLTEGITFSQSYEAEEGEGAAVEGHPVFIGLNVGREGAAFRCATINVKNQSDENALSFLKSGSVSKGLTLLSTAYPAIGPFTELAKGIGEMLLSRHQNVKVQDFSLGLDFDTGAPFGARLAEGDYIVVQAPRSLFAWSDYEYRVSDGTIRNKRTRSSVAFNYLVFRVKKHAD